MEGRRRDAHDRNGVAWAGLVCRAAVSRFCPELFKPDSKNGIFLIVFHRRFMTKAAKLLTAFVRQRRFLRS